MKQYGLVDVQRIDPTIRVHLQYADSSNFMGERLYADLHRAYLLPAAAQALSAAQQELKKIHPGKSLIVYDAARPIAVQRKMWDFYGVGPADLSSIVSQLALTEGIECAIFMYETSPHVFKVSLRSKEQLDVSVIAAHFGGGGHIRAAGCTMMGSEHDVINNISSQIEVQMERLEAQNRKNR